MRQENYLLMAKIQKDHWWYEGRRAILRHFLTRLHLPDTSTLLEAGCGTGANLAMLKEFGAVSSFEPDSYARNEARQVSGIDVQEGFLPSPVPFDTPFDVTCAFDVIEHIDDDSGSLIKLHSLTKSGGYSLFTVPAYQFLWSHHDVANHHKRRYTRSGFSSVLKQAGYEIDFISYYNTLLFPAVLAVRFAKKILGRDDIPDETMPSPAINRMLKFIFSSERFLLPLVPMPFGVSLIAICRKK